MTSQRRFVHSPIGTTLTLSGSRLILESEPSSSRAATAHWIASRSVIGLQSLRNRAITATQAREPARVNRGQGEPRDRRRTPIPPPVPAGRVRETHRASRYPGIGAFHAPYPEPRPSLFISPAAPAPA